MDLAFVFLVVILGASAIVYAGLRNPPPSGTDEASTLPDTESVDAVDDKAGEP